MNENVIIAGTGCDERIAELWISSIESAMQRFGINSNNAIAAFLGNVGVESNGFQVLTENLNYSAQGLANTWPSRFAHSPGSPVKTPNDTALALARSPQKIANAVYAGRLGNGSESSGDGWKYRGRGPIQITGRYGYTRCGEAIEFDLLTYPDKLLDPKFGALSAAWFFWQNRCISAADAGQFEEVVRLINGQMPCTANQGSRRLALTNAALAVLNG